HEPGRALAIPHVDLRIDPDEQSAARADELPPELGRDLRERHEPRLQIFLKDPQLLAKVTRKVCLVELESRLSLYGIGRPQGGEDVGELRSQLAQRGGPVPTRLGRGDLDAVLEPDQRARQSPDAEPGHRTE